jgi:hypothetical protein
MTRSQIAMLELREKERANRAKEALERRGQNLGAVTNVIGRFIPQTKVSKTLGTISKFKGRGK